MASDLEGVRLFLALDLPGEARAAIGRWRDSLLRDRPALRPVADDALHLTLVFLGRRPREMVERVWDAAVGSLEGRRGPLLAPVGCRAIPPRRPRVVALDLEDRGALAGSLHASLSTALQEAGLHEGFAAPEARPFWPHVTVARAGGRARVSEPEAPPPDLAAFTAPSVTLYRSDLHPAGARYVALERMELPLGPPSGPAAAL